MPYFIVKRDPMEIGSEIGHKTLELVESVKVLGVTSNECFRSTTRI